MSNLNLQDGSESSICDAWETSKNEPSDDISYTVSFLIAYPGVIFQPRRKDRNAGDPSMRENTVFDLIYLLVENPGFKTARFQQWCVRIVCDVAHPPHFFFFKTLKPGCSKRDHKKRIRLPR